MPIDLLLTTRNKSEEEVIAYISTVKHDNTESFGVLKNYVNVLTNLQTVSQHLTKTNTANYWNSKELNSYVNQLPNYINI